MLTYMSDCKGEWRNCYQWHTGELVNFLSKFPDNTPIHSDLYIHCRGNFNDISNPNTYTTPDKKYSMIIPDENIILYINEGFAPTSIVNIGEGRAKNLIQEAYDIVDKKKFLAMVFDIIGEDIND